MFVNLVSEYRAASLWVPGDLDEVLGDVIVVFNQKSCLDAHVLLSRSVCSRHEESLVLTRLVDLGRHVPVKVVPRWLVGSHELGDRPDFRHYYLLGIWLVLDGNKVLSSGVVDRYVPGSSRSFSLVQRMLFLVEDQAAELVRQDVGFKELVGFADYFIPRLLAFDVVLPDLWVLTVNRQDHRYFLRAHVAEG